MTELTVAICAWNAAPRLPALVAALRAQECPVPFDILIVDNASDDGTAQVAQRLASETGAPLRYVLEPERGIPHARNRAITECRARRWFAFIDTDEIPAPGWLASAVRTLRDDRADCVGGPIDIAFPGGRRPRWLGDDLTPFLGAVDHGPRPFRIMDTKTPVWSGNVAYASALFADGLCFDPRYNRRGAGIGGGSDAILFRELVARGTHIRYEPAMRILHHVEDFKLRRRYFLRLHYLTGRRQGRYESDAVTGGPFGVPPYLIRQALTQCGRTALRFLQGGDGLVRQAMNAAHALGYIDGLLRKGRA